MSREDNVAVFEDTRRQCKENEILKKAIRQATGDQFVLYEDDVVGEFPYADKHKYEEKAKVVVSKKRSYEAAAGYKGMKTCERMKIVTEYVKSHMDATTSDIVWFISNQPDFHDAAAPCYEDDGDV